MLRYSIFTLLIILIVTIVLSYSYNEEAFTSITTAAAMSGAGAPAAGAAPVAAPVAAVAAPVAAPVAAVGAPVAAPVGAIPLAFSNTKKVDTSPTNTDNQIVRDRINVATEYTNNFLRIFAAMPSLNSVQSVKYRLLSEDGTLLTNDLNVTNDIRYESASIPLSKIKPYFNTTAYIVSKGVNNINDAYASFIIPSKNNTPAVKPEVTLSDTGYEAMKLNKHSNLLNDIQKIVHNEMLANRSLDVIVKNAGRTRSDVGTGVGTGVSTGVGTGVSTGSGVGSTVSTGSGVGSAVSTGSGVGTGARTGTGARAGTRVAELEKEISKLPPALQKKAIAQMRRNIGEDSYEESDDSCTSDLSENDPDMSQYIRKDQIPCWGCSLDY